MNPEIGPVLALFGMFLTFALGNVTALLIVSINRREYDDL
jgi:hypothetical protein